MRYNISKSTVPTMPTLGKGHRMHQITPLQASNDMHEPIISTFFPIFGAHISDKKDWHSDLNWKGMCSIITYQVADLGVTRSENDGANNQGNRPRLSQIHRKGFIFPIPHKSLGMPMCKGFERWGTLFKIPKKGGSVLPDPLLGRCTILILFETRRFSY